MTDLSSFSTSESERTDLLYGIDKVSSRVGSFFLNSKNRLDICVDRSFPAADVEVEAYNNPLRLAHSRGVHIRYLTEITKENIHYCKRVMEFSEVRHLDGLRPNFGVNESECMIASLSIQNGQPLPQTIYSNVKDIVAQQHYVFETLWDNAMPAERKIIEIEEGIMEPIRSRIIKDADEISREIDDGILTNNHWYICSSYGGLELGFSVFLPSFRRALDNENHKKCGRIRWLTNFDKSGIDLVKFFLDLGIQIRYVNSVPLLQFGVGNKKAIVTSEQYCGGKIFSSAFLNNEPNYVKHFNMLFEDIWRGAIDAADRIKEIEKGIEPETVQVIRDGKQAEEALLRLSKLIRTEAQLLLLTAKTIVRAERLGVIQNLIDAANKKGADIRIICPLTDENQHIAKKIRDSAPSIRILNGKETCAGLFIVDEERYARVEVGNKNAEEVSSAVSSIIYSNSRAGARSFKILFEALWNETELAEQLEMQDKLQKEFINIAAHELRTPLQPLLGIVELIDQEFSIGKEKVEVTRNDISMIIRNAKRLERLSSDILQVTRIEANRLHLYKEIINLNEKIRNVITDIKSSIPNSKRIGFVFEPSVDPIYVELDKARIFEVLSNIINNAIKFIDKEGTITIISEIVEQKGNDPGQVQKREAIIRIVDTGKGIDPEIMPRLFTKFATKSQTGTGLGLFISKSIIEAHGGRIWAKNNEDGRGATFAFTLPLIK